MRSLPLVAVLLIGCPGETGLQVVADEAPPPRLEPELAISSESVHVGQLVLEETRETTIYLRSVGAAELRIDGLEVIGSDGWNLVDVAADDLPRRYPPGTEWPLAVRYEPLVDTNPGGLLRVLSNDPDRPLVEVILRADLVLPRIALDPPALELGDAPPGCSREGELTVSNVGEAPLRLDGAELTGDPTISADLSGLPDWLEPGEGTAVSVTFAPDDEGPATAGLVVHSSDPEEPEADAALFGGGLDPDARVDLFEAEESNGIDVLFVVDNSCSMQDDQTSLAANFPAFMDALADLAVDYRLAVTTTDGFGLLGSPPVLDPSMPNAATAFVSRVLVGSSGSGWEQGFAPAVSALEVGLGLDFPRAGAPLSIIVVSDEPDQSPGAVAGYHTSLSALAPSGLVFNGITGGPSGCGTALPAPRYGEMISLTGGLSVSICDPDWASGLTNLGTSTALQAVTSYPLTAVPIQETIAVFVEDEPSTSFVWVEALNRVTFPAGDGPVLGDEVRVEYVVAPVCSG